MRDVGGYLLVIGDRAPLAWILREQRMAFPPRRAEDASRLQVGGQLLLYTTRGCFHNPSRDRGRVIGTATVVSPVERLDRPVIFGDRLFPLGCDLSIERLAPWPRGVELAPLVPELDAFPDPATWSARMRRPLVPLSSRDTDLLWSRLEPELEDTDDARSTYLTVIPTAS
jgi:hypothetical protein